MVKQIIKIAHLYPKEMNIYGDTGNVLVLARRLEWRGIGVEVVQVGLGEKLPDDTDIIVSGGGQDKGQLDVEADLQVKKAQLRSMADAGVTMLLICGTYQLFGHRFVTSKSNEIKGVGILDIETFAGEQRLIGNVSIETDYGTLTGYENHSGETFLNKQGDVEPLGLVVLGEGNNTTDKSEGAVRKNVFGTYMHGPLLPKNPAFADELLSRAMNLKYGKAELTQLEDKLERAAHKTALNRPR